MQLLEIKASTNQVFAKARQVFLFLFLGSKIPDQRADERILDFKHDAHTHINLCYFLNRQNCWEEIQPGSTIFRLNLHWHKLFKKAK